MLDVLTLRSHAHGMPVHRVATAARARVVVVDQPDGSVYGAVAGAASRRLATGPGGIEVTQVGRYEAGATADLVVVAERHVGKAVLGPRIIVATSAASGDPYVSGIDVLALLRDGAAGVVDAGVLVSPDAIDLCVAAVRVADGRIVVGAPAHELVRLRSEVIDWGFDDDPDLDRLCFKLALALAQLPVLRPAPMPSGRRNYGDERFAIALNAHRETTGFHYTASHLRKAIGRLCRIWAPAEVLPDDDPETVQAARVQPSRLLSRQPADLDGEQKVLLPELARAHGFPRRLPTLRDIPRELVGQALWETLEPITTNDIDQAERFGTIVLRFHLPHRTTPPRVEGGTK